MCLQIQEDRLRILLSSVECSERQICAYKSHACTFLGVVRFEEMLQKSTFFDFFQTFLHFVALYIYFADLQSSQYDPLECVDWFWSLIEHLTILRSFSELPEVLLTHSGVAKTPPKNAHIYGYQNLSALKNGSVRSLNTIWVSKCVSAFWKIVLEQFRAHSIALECKFQLIKVR